MAGAKWFILFEDQRGWRAVPPGYTNTPGEISGFGQLPQEAVEKLIANKTFQQQAQANGWPAAPAIEEFFLVPSGVEISWNHSEPMIGHGFERVELGPRRPNRNRLPEGRIWVRTDGSGHDVVHIDEDGTMVSESFEGPGSYDDALRFAGERYEEVEVGQAQYPAEDRSARLDRRRQEVTQRLKPH